MDRIRIVLRSVRKEDWSAVQKMFVEYNASAFGKYDRIGHTDKSHVLAFLDGMVREHVIYAIAKAETDEMIGYICFHIDGDAYDVGYMVSSACQGMGIATAASRQAMERLYSERGAKVFTATVAAENRPSVNVLEKLGFSLISETRVEKEDGGTVFRMTERRYVKRFS